MGFALRRHFIIILLLGLEGLIIHLVLFIIGSGGVSLFVAIMFLLRVAVLAAAVGLTLLLSLLRWLERGLVSGLRGGQ